MHPLYEQMDVSVFERMSRLAAEHDAVNLGQGFPDFGWPDSVVRKAAQAMVENSNQYAPSRGLMEQREAVADHYNRHHGTQIDAAHVIVTSGATEALAAAIFAMVGQGDEVVIFTPAFDAYVPMIRRAGGIPVEVRLEAPDFRMERDRIEQAISEKTSLILFCNPHNPTGRVFDAEELSALAAVAEAHDLPVLSDEVWEHVLLGGQAFTPFAQVAGMAPRTVKCGSAGKVFSLTGWKNGWLVAPPEQADLLAKAHQYITFSSPPNIQSAVAFGLNGDEGLEEMRKGFTAARERIMAGLADAGYEAINPEGTYFITIDLAASGIDMDDETFAVRAVREAGVAVVPMGSFYVDNPPTNLIRLCFAKKDSVIDAGVAALAAAKRLFA